MDSWTVPLLTSLIELREETWVVHHDTEDGEEQELIDKDFQFMIDSICSG